MAAARKAMIDSQLRTSGVNAPFVLARMSRVPREDYVPERFASVAYTDRAIDLGGGARLAAPLFYGKMLEEAAPLLDDRALVVSAAPGYLVALVEPLVRSVATLAPEEAAAGPAGREPYDLVLIDGVAEEIPPGLAALLAEDGRAVLGTLEKGVTRIARARRAGDGWAMLPLMELGIPRLTAFDRPSRWAF
jgi:protein-L-isoaspartate(D-aspartate) O-methyltransferase